MSRRRRLPPSPYELLSDANVRRLTHRELVRAAVVGGVLNRHLLPGLVRKRGRTAAAAAPRIHRAVVRLGPPFVKLSQLVSSSPGLFPAPISNELRVLLDGAPPAPWPPIRDTIEAALGAPVTERFGSIDAEPLAAASIAQVHAATRLDGTPVVVKVKRPGVEHQFLADLRLLRRIAGLAERVSKEAHVLNPVAVVDDVVHTLRQELDFRREAEAMERFAANLRSFGANHCIRVPAVHHDLCGPGVLTMERVDGITVDDIERLRATGRDLVGLLKAGVRAWIEAAAEHGFFHGDVHAGNLMLDAEGNVVFLDFGIMGELDDVTRHIVRRGVVALLHKQDFVEVTRCLAELGSHLGHDVGEERAAKAIARLAVPLIGTPIGEIDYQQVFVAAVRQAARHGVQVPRSLVLLMKQVIYFERYAKLIAPEYDILSDLSLIDFMIDDLGPDARPASLTG